MSVTSIEIAPLSLEQPTADFLLGDFIARYSLKGKAVEFIIFPASKADKVVARRKSGQIHAELPVGNFRETHNFATESLAQIAVRGHAAHRNWSSGGTMRNSASTDVLSFETQTVEESNGSISVNTQLSSEFGFNVSHLLIWDVGAEGVRIETTLTNTGKEPLPVEMLSSFSMGGMSPFVEDDAAGRMKLHRFRSTWSNEGQHAVQDFAELNMERTWGGGPVYLRYGQAGSLPVRKFHPWIGVEDSAEKVLWGATIAWHGSWQMELYRRDDSIAISGGLGDYESAHWMKELAPGDSFTAPTALVATCVGGIDDLSQRLVNLQESIAYSEPAHERSLPIIFNEWCSSWGKPDHDYLVRTADCLQNTDTKYLVIDDGWAEKPAGADIQFNGDWKVNEKGFPHGMGATTKAIRERGLIPGIWFEFEPCTEGTEAFKQIDHQLHRHGQVLQVGNRHFWDFRDPWTFEYLTEKVIKLLNDNNFGYLKVDYNESIGIGCDGAESLGEGLRQHLVKVKEFFAKIRAEVPGIVVENCASGGHRLEPGMVGLTSMSSSSDAHETVEIPIISAQLHRLIPAYKNQIWAVLRPDDSMRRLYYSLAATFMGRMCISGDVVDLSEDRFQVLKDAQSFYHRVKHVIASGHSRLQDYSGISRRYPTGWQALVRQAEDGNSLIVVLHGFDLSDGSISAEVRLPEGDWVIAETLNPELQGAIQGGSRLVSDLVSFSGSVFYCKKI